MSPVPLGEGSHENSEYWEWEVSTNAKFSDMHKYIKFSIPTSTSGRW